MAGILDDLINKIICADCMDILPLLPDKCVDLVLTDVPYKMDFVHGMGIRKHRPNYNKISAYGANADLDFADFFDLCVKKMSKINFFTFCDKTTKFEFLKLAEKYGYGYREIPFCKTSPTPFENNQWLNDVEWGIHIFHKAPVYGDYKTKRGWFLVDNLREPDIKHPTPKRIAVIEKLLLNMSITNQIVLDPFAGSGTTAVACHKWNRRFICIEKDPEYATASIKRLEQAQRQQTLF